MSRHRGAKPPRRCELLGEISLLSPEYLLSDERRPFHSEPPDHYDLLSYLLDVSVLQSSSLMPLHSKPGFQSGGGNLRAPPLLFRRRPPQSNCPPDIVPHPAYGCRLGIQTNQGGISRLTPPRPESRFQRLPPILRKLIRMPVSSCSKGSRGLSVLPRVRGIFTPSATSLSPCSRQWGSRYAIRAGRNLPDKEFRYLRTVIVTAAVYRGFDSELRPKADSSS
jgi:hypothetical protein